MVKASNSINKQLAAVNNNCQWEHVNWFLNRYRITLCSVLTSGILVVVVFCFEYYNFEMAKKDGTGYPS